jgi:diacylglycerol kinase (ATP)
MAKPFSIADRLKSFVHAYNGIKYVLLTQHNFIIHLCLLLIAIILGFYLKINTSEWIAIIIVAGLVLFAEIINTAIEKLVDFIEPNNNKVAGLIKDIAAGAVLVLAMAALITGTLIFLPKILELL